MIRTVCIIFSAMFFCALSYADDYKDHPLLSRPLGAEVRSYEHSDFDAQEFFAREADGKVHGQKKEGSVTRISYRLEKETSALAISRNIENSLKKAGFLLRLKLSDEELQPIEEAIEKTIVGPGYILLSLNPMYIYMSRQTVSGVQHLAICISNVSSSTFFIYYLILEEQQQVFIPLDVSSASIAAGLKENGKIELYGINFDTGKSVVKPESTPTLDKIVKLLKDNPSLKLRIVGHTDNTGDFAANLQLSEQRAQAVLAALVQKFHIDKTRLSAHGVGSLAPLSTNSNDFGRSKNRRVELVQE